MLSVLLAYILSLIFSAVGIGISLFALFKAINAQDMGDLISLRHSERQSSDELRKLIDKLSLAKDAAKRRRAVASRFLSSGYSEEMDVHLLHEADDALKTVSHTEMEGALLVEVRKAATEMERAVADVAQNNSYRDGWQDALSTLQVIIPRLEGAEREMKQSQSRAVKVP